MTRVIVAMSGGVDSSVAAALLKEKGYEVIGITMHIWEGNSGSCCSLSSAEDAKKTAKKLGIPHYVLNFKDCFKKKVINNFYKEYKSGRTPNPCIRCNQYLKFDALLQKTKEIDGDFLATGHYARIEYNVKNKKYLLKKGADKNKDQSYVLYTLNQQQLKNVFFPVGDLTKEEIRKYARKIKLSVAEKAESQEICFVEKGNYQDFIKENLGLEPKPGDIVDLKGNILGKHEGIINYTIGQRRGLGIAFKRPFYVVALKTRSNEVIVGFKEDVYSDSLFVKDIKLISMDKIREPLKVKAKIRYRNEESAVIIKPCKKGFQVNFKNPQWAITPGQSVVFYDGEYVIGGGIIEKARKGEK